MVFCADAAMALALLALAAGTWLLLSAAKEGVCCNRFAKVIGIIIVAISLFLILCTGYHKFIYWKSGEMGCSMTKGGGMGMMHRKMMDMMNPGEHERMMKTMKEGGDKGE